MLVDVVDVVAPHRLLVHVDGVDVALDALVVDQRDTELDAGRRHTGADTRAHRRPWPRPRSWSMGRRTLDAAAPTGRTQHHDHDEPRAGDQSTRFASPRPPACGCRNTTRARRAPRGRRTSSRRCRRASASTRSGSSSVTNSVSWLTSTIAPFHVRSAAPIAARDGGSRLLVGSSSSSRLWLPGDEHRERELRLLAAGQRARVLEHDLAVQPEHAEQARRYWSGSEPRRRACARARSRPGDDALVLLRVVAERHLVAERDRRRDRPRARRRASRSNVVLPAPLSPSTSSRSPRPTSNVTSSNTVLGPNALARSSTSSATRPDVRRLGQAHPHLALARAAVTRFARRACRRGGRASSRYAPASRSGRASSRRACCSRSISLSWRAASLARRSSSACARHEVLRVGAAVLDELAFVDVQHARDRLVEQLEVVADHEQRAAVRTQEPHEPLLRVDVEVVRRLVEQQQVAAGEQDARELDAPAFTAGERGDRKVETVGGRGRGRPRSAGPRSRPRTRPRCGTRPRRRCSARTLRSRRVGVHLAVQLLEPAAGRVEPAARQHVRRARCRRGRRRAATGPAAGTRPRRAQRRHPPPAAPRPRAPSAARSCPTPLRPDEPDLVAGAQRERGAGRA